MTATINIEVPYGYREFGCLSTTSFPVPRVGEHVTCIKKASTYVTGDRDRKVKLVVESVEYDYTSKSSSGVVTVVLAEPV